MVTGRPAERIIVGVGIKSLDYGLENITSLASSTHTLALLSSLLLVFTLFQQAFSCSQLVLSLFFCKQIIFLFLFPPLLTPSNCFLKRLPL